MGNSCACVKDKADDVEIINIEDSVIREKCSFTVDKDQKDLDDMYPCRTTLGREAEKALGSFKFDTQTDNFLGETILSAEG